MMPYFPVRGLPPLPTIHPNSIEAAGLAQGLPLFSAASATYPAANRALLVPFHIEMPILITLLLSANGATASGNIDVGIYSADFTRIVSAGSTAQSGTNAAQTFNIADVILGAGDYYLAVAMDNTTGTLFRQNLGVQPTRRAGVLQMASAFPLPATITPATIASSYLPIIALRQGGTAV